MRPRSRSVDVRPIHLAVSRSIEVLDGRSRRTVERYLGSLSEHQRTSIEVVSIDPYEAYRQAVQAAVPNARIVAEHFHLVRGVHLVRGANTALDAVRRHRQRAAARRRRAGSNPSWKPSSVRA